MHPIVNGARFKQEINERGATIKEINEPFEHYK